MYRSGPGFGGGFLFKRKKTICQELGLDLKPHSFRINPPPGRGGPVRGSSDVGHTKPSRPHPAPREVPNDHKV